MEIWSLLETGQFLRLQAQVRPRAARAALKCDVAGAVAAHSLQVAAVLHAARLWQDALDPEQQVCLSFSREVAGSRNWELAAVLADKFARAGIDPAARGEQWLALGFAEAEGGAEDDADAWCDANLNAVFPPDYWQQIAAQFQPHPQHPVLRIFVPAALAPQLQAAALAAGMAIRVTAVDAPRHIVQRQGLLLRRAQAWFPVLGQHDHLSRVAVVLRALPQQRLHQQQAGDAGLHIVGVDALRAQHITQVLQQAAQFDAESLLRAWQAQVFFASNEIVGQSWQLAAVLALRIALGLELAAGGDGRLLASGKIGAWPTATVETVDGCRQKCALLAAHARPGDRILLPVAWQAEMPPQWAQQIGNKGASWRLMSALQAW